MGCSSPCPGIMHPANPPPPPLCSIAGRVFMETTVIAPTPSAEGIVATACEGMGPQLRYLRSARAALQAAAEEEVRKERYVRVSAHVIRQLRDLGIEVNLGIEGSGH